ncbi:DUF4169 family protein [Sphingomonas crusticola]|uniref:DUF4169 family protein n=1 Tax=Sphingomonas crusticola TaxID=1697973 RepID=UPI000E21F95B|nr:DUF4169 family protein [Sphingomonas crusticola]
MGDVINLRRARRARQRLSAGESAAQARAFHGRTKAERLAAQAETERLTRHVEQSRLEKSASDGEAGSILKENAD